MERYYISYLGNIAEYLIYQSEHFPKCLNQTNIIDNASDQFTLIFYPILPSVHLFIKKCLLSTC